MRHGLRLRFVNALTNLGVTSTPIRGGRRTGGAVARAARRRALLVSSLRSLERRSPGFDRDHLLVVDVDEGARLHRGATPGTRSRAESAVRCLPGVTASSFSENGLFSGSDWSTEVNVPGFVARTSADTNSHYDQVRPRRVSTAAGPCPPSTRTIDRRRFAEPRIRDDHFAHTQQTIARSSGL